MDLKELKAACQAGLVPEQLTPPTKAMGLAKLGKWDEAHALVQSESTHEAAWVHAYLHRVEGDESNAQYWYEKAGKEHPLSSLDEEWEHIVTCLLNP
ncbi:MAG: hypothetical protein SGI71_03755 [Verrucomicrobiota bacterium]|nr:hypothetical protein [Verrucomicrobiota bacterium]